MRNISAWFLYAVLAHVLSAQQSIDIPPDLVLDIDAGLVRRALMQLLENAHKYSPPDSPIEIDARGITGRIY